MLEEDEIALSQDVFAKMLGVQRSSVSPILQKLRRDGLIALERSRLRLLNRPGLLARACECYNAMRAEQGLWSEIRQEIAQNSGVKNQIWRPEQVSAI